MAAKERAIRVGDKIVVWATGYLRQVTVTKVTDSYIWVEYVSPSTGRYHNTKFYRYHALLGTKYF